MVEEEQQVEVVVDCCYKSEEDYLVVLDFRKEVLAEVKEKEDDSADVIGPVVERADCFQCD